MKKDDKEKNENYRLEICKFITLYIEYNYSNFSETAGVNQIYCVYLNEVSIFNNIIGKMEVYLEQEDWTNFDLMSSYFEKTLETCGYSMNDLIEFKNTYSQEK